MNSEPTEPSDQPQPLTPPPRTITVMPPESTPAPAPRKRSHFWKIFTLGIISFIVGPIVLFIMFAMYLVRLANQGASGTEFMILLGVPLLYLSGLAALVAVIAAVVYFVRRRPRGSHIILPTLAIGIGLLIVTPLVMNFINVSRQESSALNDSRRGQAVSRAVALGQVQSCDARRLVLLHETGDYPAALIAKDHDTSEFIYKADLTSIEDAITANRGRCGGIGIVKENDGGGGDFVVPITADDANNLLTTCQVQEVDMPGENQYFTTMEQQALAQTGVYEDVTFQDAPIAIGFTQAQSPNIVPAARQASHSCKLLEFNLGSGKWTFSL